MMSAMSSRLAMIRSNQRRRILARSLGSALAQGPNALSAASIARTVSAWPKRGTLAISAPVAGLWIASTPSPTQAPSMRHWLLSRVGSASFMGRASGEGTAYNKGCDDWHRTPDPVYLLLLVAHARAAVSPYPCPSPDGEGGPHAADGANRHHGLYQDSLIRTCRPSRAFRWT